MAPVQGSRNARPQLHRGWAAPTGSPREQTVATGRTAHLRVRQLSCCRLDVREGGVTRRSLSPLPVGQDPELGRAVERTRGRWLHARTRVGLTSSAARRGSRTERAAPVLRSVSVTTQAFL